MIGPNPDGENFIPLGFDEKEDPFSSPRKGGSPDE